MNRKARLRGSQDKEETCKRRKPSVLMELFHSRKQHFSCRGAGNPGIRLTCEDRLPAYGCRGGSKVSPHVDMRESPYLSPEVSSDRGFGITPNKQDMRLELGKRGTEVSYSKKEGDKAKNIGAWLLESTHASVYKTRLVYESLLVFLDASEGEISDFRYLVITDVIMAFATRILVSALIYFRRYITRCKKVPNRIAFYLSIFISCLLIGSKYMDDHSLRVEDVCMLFNIPLKSLFAVESHVLNVLSLDLRIDEKEYSTFIYSIQ